MDEETKAHTANRDGDATQHSDNVLRSCTNSFNPHEP